MIYTTHTQIDISTIKTELEAKAKAVDFSLLKTYEFKNILEGKGFPIKKEIIVFELCNPAAAQQALTNLAKISVYLPCRISVYEENGGTTLATIEAEDIVSTIEVDKEFKEFMNLIFANLKQIMHSWDN